MKNLLLLALTFLFVACATETKKEIEMEKRSYSDNMTREELIEKAREMIENSKSFTRKQKDEVLALHTDVMTKVQKIHSELRKSKMILFKELLKEKQSYKRTRVLKKDIKKLYDKKISVMYEAWEKGQKILRGNKQAMNEIFQFVELDMY